MSYRALGPVDLSTLGTLAGPEACEPGLTWYEGDVCCSPGQAPYHEADGSVYCMDIPCSPGQTLSPTTGKCVGGATSSGAASLSATTPASIGAGRMSLVTRAAMPWVLVALALVGGLYAYQRAGASA